MKLKDKYIIVLKNPYIAFFILGISMNFLETAPTHRL